MRSRDCQSAALRRVLGGLMALFPKSLVAWYVIAVIGIDLALFRSFGPKPRPIDTLALYAVGWPQVGLVSIWLALGSTGIVWRWLAAVVTVGAWIAASEQQQLPYEVRHLTPGLLTTYATVTLLATLLLRVIWQVRLVHAPSATAQLARALPGSTAEAALPASSVPADTRGRSTRLRSTIATLLVAAATVAVVVAGYQRVGIWGGDRDYPELLVLSSFAAVAPIFAAGAVLGSKSIAKAAGIFVAVVVPWAVLDAGSIDGPREFPQLLLRVAALLVVTVFWLIVPAVAGWRLVSMVGEAETGIGDSTSRPTGGQ